MCWHEVLLATVGEVNKGRSPYTGKHAVRDMRACRQANLGLLRSCGLENRKTGERIDLISKVMGGISNPEIRRMELVGTIVGIGCYTAAEGNVGTFITLTAPSKYHPMRQARKSENKAVQLNHGRNDEAFNPKDTQRYLCHIWSLTYTAFKDNDLQVYDLCVIGSHHDGMPHWRMMLFCNPRRRNQITETMRCYVLKEDDDEKGAERSRFQARHLNRGGAVGYIAKYVSENIDGYTLDGQLDNDTDRPLKDTTAAVTVWTSTWRILQFETVGLPIMGAYRELHKLPHGISIADEFDERVEAIRAVADSGDFTLRISAQDEANVPCDRQAVRVAHSPSDEVNKCEKEVKRVVGIYAPYLGVRHIRITRTTGWCTVSKVPIAEPLALKGGIAAPRSPVNDYEKFTGGDTSLPAPTPSEHAAIMLNLVSDGVTERDDPEIVRVPRGILKYDPRMPNRQQGNGGPLKPHEIAPSARLARSERM